MLVCYLICQYFDIFFPCKPPVNVSLARLSALITYCQFTSGQINHVQPGSMLSVDCVYAWFMIGFPLEVSSPHKLKVFLGGEDIYGRTCHDGYLTKKWGIFPLLYVPIGDYSTTFEVF